MFHSLASRRGAKLCSVTGPNTHLRLQTRPYPPDGIGKAGAFTVPLRCELNLLGRHGFVHSFRADKIQAYTRTIGCREFSKSGNIFFPAALRLWLRVMRAGKRLPGH